MKQSATGWPLYEQRQGRSRKLKAPIAAGRMMLRSNSNGPVCSPNSDARKTLSVPISRFSRWQARHFGALNNLGVLLHAAGFRSAARTAYTEAVTRHPDNPKGHLNLANAA